MKTKVVLAAVVLITVLSAFKLAPDTKSTATAEQQQGVYIFLLSKPINAYDYLGTVKVPEKWSGSPREQLTTALNKLKKDFPSANGIIFQDVDMKKADAIKIKD